MTVDRAARSPHVGGALRASPSFRGLSEPALRGLGGAATHRSFADGEELEPDPSGTPCLYLVAEGEVSAATPPDSDGISEVVGREGPGGVLGSRLITGDEDATVYRAAGTVEAYVWELPALERLFEESGDLRRQLDTRLSVRRRRSELVDLLRHTPLFRQAGQSLIRWLVASSTLGHYAAGSPICREGDAGDAMFVVVSGEVAIFREDDPDPLRQLGRGEFFGEIALVEESVRTASAIAMSDSEILIVGKHAFDVLYGRSSSFRDAVRLTAEMRLAATVAAQPDPELVWLVNDTARPTVELAALLVDALRDVGARVADPYRLRGPDGVEGALGAGRRAGTPYVLCFSAAPIDATLGRHVADQAGGVVYFTDDAAAAFPYPSPLLHRVHHVVIAGTTAAPRQAVRSGAFTLRLPPDEDRDSFRRIARAIGHRRVGVALGGGAAWGYAHVALLRGLERARVPVDTLVGVSVGSIVGAFYASQGLPGLDRLADAKLELSAAAFAAIGTTSSVGLFLRRHVPETRLEELALPFATVAVEADTGREKVFRHGSLSTAVRASCSLPGVFGPPLFGGRRYLDACVRHNVPVRYCTEADADFVIACDVVPTPRASRDVRRGVRSLALELFQVNRLTDTVRSLYWLASDSGRLQAGLADALFAPDLSEFFPWDFHRAGAIIERTDEQLDEWLAATEARYRALSRPWRAHG